MYNNYNLEVISHHPEFSGKTLKKYHVDGIDTIGAFGSEPFSIYFKNNTSQKIQVKLSLDGTDILTGKPANTEITKDMWVVNGYGTLQLKCWPETHNGGSQFVFTSADKSVALHTHGDLSSRGIIAAAVFVEGYVEPIPLPRRYYDKYFDYNRGGFDYGILGGSLNSKSLQSNVTRSGVTNSSISNTYNDISDLVAIGAGEHVDQKITYTTGLIKPIFTEAVRVRYLWWDHLKERLEATGVEAPHPSGFPGDKPIMSIGNTPKIGGNKQPFFPRQVGLFSRV